MTELLKGKFAVTNMVRDWCLKAFFPMRGDFVSCAMNARIFYDIAHGFNLSSLELLLSMPLLQANLCISCAILI